MMSEPVNFEIFEGSKENIQPLIRGRDPVILKQLFDTTTNKAPKKTEEELEQKRNEYEEKIRTYVGDDPLCCWLDYIAWTQQMYVAGGIKSLLIQLLEKCTKEFQHDERYRNSEKYLKVWIIYADNTQEPEEIFVFLQHNSIGQKLSLFYEAYSLVLEARGKFSHALAVLDSGNNVQAQPLVRIRNALSRAQARAVRRAEQLIQAQNDPFGMPTRHITAAAAISESNERQVLSRLSKKRGTVSQTQLPAPTNALQLAKQPPRNASFQVFCDEEQGTNMNNKGSVAVWDDLHSQSNKEKENTGTASTWNSGALPSQAKYSKKKHVHHKFESEIEVFVDECCVDSQPAPQPNMAMALRKIDVAEQKDALASALAARLAPAIQTSLSSMTSTSSASSSPVTLSISSTSISTVFSSMSPALPVVTNLSITSSPPSMVSQATTHVLPPAVVVTTGSTLSQERTKELLAPAASNRAIVSPTFQIFSDAEPSFSSHSSQSFISTLPLSQPLQPITREKSAPNLKRSLVFEDVPDSTPSQTYENKASGSSSRARISSSSRVVSAVSVSRSSSSSSCTSSISKSSSSTLPKVGGSFSGQRGTKPAQSSISVFCDEDDSAPPPPKQKQNKKSQDSLENLLDFDGLLD